MDLLCQYTAPARFESTEICRSVPHEWAVGHRQLTTWATRRVTGPSRRRKTSTTRGTADGIAHPRVGTRIAVLGCDAAHFTRTLLHGVDAVPARCNVGGRGARTRAWQRHAWCSPPAGSRRGP